MFEVGTSCWLTLSRIEEIKRPFSCEVKALPTALGHFHRIILFIQLPISNLLTTWAPCAIGIRPPRDFFGPLSYIFSNTENSHSYFSWHWKVVTTEPFHDT
jgi:hypothetical protein